MQDEISKHTKKIYKTAKDRQHTLAEKAGEIIIEICIIVFAVTISIYFHNWSEHRHEQAEAHEFLLGLKTDLKEDMKLLEENRNVSIKIDSNFLLLSSLRNYPPAQADSIIKTHLFYDIRVTHPKIGRYDGFKSSGKIETIENDSLKQNILTFYQQTIPDLADGEEYTNSLQLKIFDLQIDNQNSLRATKDFITSGKINAMLQVAKHNLDINVLRYNNALAQAKRIVEEINKETKD